jgi:hypothetical protein
VDQYASDLPGSTWPPTREYLREELLKGIRVLEARLDAAAPPPAAEPSDPH